MRQRRRSLSAQAQTAAAHKLLIRCSRNPLVRSAQSLAFYWPSDGEISPLPLMHLALRRGRRCYLPAVDSRTLRMTFKRYRHGDPLTRNAFGIPEPTAFAASIPANMLDVVFMPLVAFDANGNRLGMGGGFYDRAFAKLRGRKPLRIGLAHSCQKVPELCQQSWDVPLHGICSEKTFLLF